MIIIILKITVECIKKHITNIYLTYTCELMPSDTFLMWLVKKGRVIIQFTLYNF